MSPYSFCRISARAWRNRGFTLIELMVAMLLGLIVIAGVSSVFLANLRSYHTNEALSDVQSNARIAFELMARDIREAGATGCNSVNNRITNVLGNSPGNDATPAWWADWGNAVRGYDGSQMDPAPPDSGDGRRVATGADSPDSLELLSAGSMSVTIQTDVSGTNFFLNEPTTKLTGGDIIMACSPDHAAILQISGYNDSNVTVGYNTGDEYKPGNCSSNLGYPNDACTGNSPDYTFPPNSSISKLTAVDWYIGINPVGGRSLYRIALVSSNKGGATPRSQEMVRSVTDMQILYLQPGTHGNQFVPATEITDWGRVSAVRVTLVLQSTDRRVGTDAKPLERSITFTTTIRNRVS